MTNDEIRAEIERLERAAGFDPIGQEQIEALREQLTALRAEAEAAEAEAAAEVRVAREDDW